MAQPPAYTLSHNFTNQQATFPSDPLPAAWIDSEFTAIQITFAATLANLALMQRDDGALKNNIVTMDTLSVAVQAQINQSPGAFAASAAASAQSASTSNLSAFNYQQLAYNYQQNAYNYSTDAFTSKTAAEAAAAGMKWRPSVRAATTVSISFNGLQTIDGVALNAGDRVLVKDQTTASQNGVWVAAAGTWVRATDADTWAKLVSQVVQVDEGATWADYTFICTVNAGGTLGTTNVVWANQRIPLASVGYDRLAADVVPGLSLPGLRGGTLNQSRLVISGGNLLLTAVNGDGITIDGVNRSLQLATNPLAPTGFSAGVVIYIYAVWNGSSISLSAVTTSYTRNASGLAVRADNAAQTLVGMVYCTTGGTFAGALLRSFMNRQANLGMSNNGTTLTTTTATNAEFPGMTRCPFLIWAGESVKIEMNAVCQQSAATTVAVGNFIDGGCPAINGFYVASANINAQFTICSTYHYGPGALGEGYHYTSIAGSTGTGTLSLLGGSRAMVTITD